jgi:long-subunit fatty acid transport protein
MERSIKSGLVLAALLLVSAEVRAEGDDFGIWTEANVEKKISRNLSVDGGVEMRTRDHVKTVDRWSGSIGASYKLTDWLKASAGYTLLYDNNEKWNDKQTKVANFWGTRHRFNVSLTGSVDFGNLSVSLRERWQYTYRPEKTVERTKVSNGKVEEKTYNGKGKNVWRNRLQLKYKVSSLWRPYINGETYVAGSGMDKYRLAAGTEIRLSKKHSFDLKYMFQKSCSDDEEEGNRHIIGVGYTFKF